MKTVSVFAPAKINLALHVTGQRADGYHLLDSLVAFADIGDRVRLQSHGPARLLVSGPEAVAGLEGGDNIMWRAAHRFWPPDLSLSMHLEKHLPVASGIGGGSADAAATYRGLLMLQAAVNGGERPRDPTAQDARDLLVAGDPAAAVEKLRRCRQIRPGAEPAAVDYFLGLALFQATADDAEEPLREALSCFEAAAAAQVEAGGDPGLAVLYRVRTLLRLGESEPAAALADSYLESVGEGGDPDTVDRIRRAIGR